MFLALLFINSYNLLLGTRQPINKISGPWTRGSEARREEEEERGKAGRRKGADDQIALLGHKQLFFSEPRR